jgi:hypothetical protein
MTPTKLLISPVNKMDDDGLDDMGLLPSRVSIFLFVAISRPILGITIVAITWME